MVAFHSMLGQSSLAEWLSSWPVGGFKVPDDLRGMCNEGFHCFESNRDSVTNDSIFKRSFDQEIQKALCDSKTIGVGFEEIEEASGKNLKRLKMKEKLSELQRTFNIFEKVSDSFVFFFRIQ